MTEKTQLEQLLEAIEEAKLWERRMHEAQQGLKQTIQEARDLAKEVMPQFREHLELVARAEVSTIAPAVHKANDATIAQHSRMLEDAVTRVMLTLDRINNTYKQAITMMESSGTFIPEVTSLPVVSPPKSPRYAPFQDPHKRRKRKSE